MGEVVAGVVAIQMGVEVEVVVAEEATKTGAIHTTTSLEIIIQGTTITTEEEEAEVVDITTTMVRVVKLIMWQVTWGCINDELWVVYSAYYCHYLVVNQFLFACHETCFEQFCFDT